MSKKLLVLGVFLLFLILIIGGIWGVYHFTQDRSYDRVLVEDKTNVEYLDSLTNDELLKNLGKPLNNPCEARFQESEYQLELQNYPVINLPMEGEYTVVSSLRNFVASSLAIDVLDSEGHIVNTIYEVESYAMNSTRDQIAFIGFLDSDNTESCETKTYGILDIAGQNLTELDFSTLDFESLSDPIRLEWSPELNISATLLTSDGVQLIQFDSITGDILESVNIGFDEIEKSGLGMVRPLKGWFNNEMEGIKLIVGDYDNNYLELDFTTDGIYRDYDVSEYEDSHNCEIVTYLDEGTSVFCQGW
jgi:hypothetical protein